jgi:hypothetical protein
LDGVHTNWVEGIYGCLKKMRQKYDVNWAGVDNLEFYLGVFCFGYSFSFWDRRRAFILLVHVLKEVKFLLDSGAVE